MEGGAPDGLLLQGREVDLLVVGGSVVAGQVAVVVQEGRVVLKAGEAAVRVAAVGRLVQLLGHLPDAARGQRLHQILHQWTSPFC